MTGMTFAQIEAPGTLPDYHPISNRNVEFRRVLGYVGVHWPTDGCLVFDVDRALQDPQTTANEGVVNFPDGLEYLEEVHRLTQAFQRFNHVQVLRVSNGGQFGELTVEDRDLISILRANVKSKKKHPLVREVSGVLLLNAVVALDKERAKEVEEAVPAESPAWVFAPLSAGSGLGGWLGDRATTLKVLRSIGERNTIPNIKGYAIWSEVHDSVVGGQEPDPSLVEVLRRDFADLPPIKSWLTKLPEKLQAEAELPTLELGEGRSIVAGPRPKALLLNAWMPGCGALALRTKELQTLQARLDASEIEVVSLRLNLPGQRTFDPESEAEMKTLDPKAIPVEGDLASELVQVLGIRTKFFSLLVGKDGRVAIANDAFERSLLIDALAPVLVEGD